MRSSDYSSMYGTSSIPGNIENNDTSILPVEIIRMRAKVRQVHEAILKEKKDRMTEEEEAILRSRLDKLRPSWKSDELNLATEILHVYEEALERYYKEDLDFSQLQGQAKLDYTSRSLTKSKENYYHHKDTNIETINILKLEEIAKHTYIQSNEYLQLKHNKASQELQIALDNMLHDTEIEGEELWKREVSKVIRDWEEGGPLREAFEESQKESWDIEENIVSEYVRDQKTMASTLASKELRKEIRKEISSRVINIDKMTMSLTNMADSYIASIETYANITDNRGGADELDMTASLIDHANTIRNRIEKSLKSVKELYKDNMMVAAKVAIVKEVSSQLPGDDMELIGPFLLEML
eukprot:gene800-1553_t